MAESSQSGEEIISLDEESGRSGVNSPSDENQFADVPGFGESSRNGSQQSQLVDMTVTEDNPIFLTGRSQDSEVVSIEGDPNVSEMMSQLQSSGESSRNGSQQSQLVDMTVTEDNPIFLTGRSQDSEVVSIDGDPNMTEMMSQLQSSVQSAIVPRNQSQQLMLHSGEEHSTTQLVPVESSLVPMNSSHQLVLHSGDSQTSNQLIPVDIGGGEFHGARFGPTNTATRKTGCIEGGDFSGARLGPTNIYYINQSPSTSGVPQAKREIEDTSGEYEEQDHPGQDSSETLDETPALSERTFSPTETIPKEDKLPSPADKTQATVIPRGTSTPAFGEKQENTSVEGRVTSSEVQDPADQSAYAQASTPNGDDGGIACGAEISYVQLSVELNRRIKTRSMKSKIISPLGGFVKNFGWTATFPAKAFDKVTTVGTSVITDFSDCPEGKIPIAPIIECRPSGILNRPVFLEAEHWAFPTSDDTPVYAEVFRKDSGDTDWKFVKKVRIIANEKISFNIEHFSLYEIVVDYAAWLWTGLTRPFVKVNLQNLVYISGVDQSVVCVSRLKDAKVESDVLRTLENAGYRSIPPLPANVHTYRGEEVKLKIRCMDPQNMRIVTDDGEGNMVEQQEVEKKFSVNAIQNNCEQTCSLPIRLQNAKLKDFEGELLFRYSHSADGDDGAQHLLQIGWPSTPVARADSSARPQFTYVQHADQVVNAPGSTTVEGPRKMEGDITAGEVNMGTTSGTSHGKSTTVIRGGNM